VRRLIGTILLILCLAAGVASCDVAADEQIVDAPPPAAVEREASTEPADLAPIESVSQQNARESAEAYIQALAFSRSGLIHQLRYEGFSKADAEYGVNAVRPNWNAQAAKSAQSYLDSSSFSRQGLIDQLKYEGFTPQQAVYGVTQVGL
jgi:hypothetical protein